MHNARAALLLATAGAAGGVRLEVPFSYAWRFHLGPFASGGPGNGWAFPQLVRSCEGTKPNPNRLTAGDCATACAYNPACMSWIHASGTRTCAHGNASAVCVPTSDNATATGALRTAATPLQTNYAFAAAGLPEDAGWPLVDAPHDALMSTNNSFSETLGDQGHGYRVRTVVWYRKHFALPADWAPGAHHVFLRFEGVVHVAQLWLNGVYLGMHTAGYTGFSVRLDNVTAAVWGGGANVLALRVDASFGSEHWYGGGGITRPVWLVRTDAAANLVEDGVYAPAELAAGATSAAVAAEWQNSGAAGSVTATVRFALLNTSSGEVLAEAASAPATLPPGGAGTATAVLPLPPAVLARLWSTQAPTLYTLNVSLAATAGGAATDSVLVTVGYRTTRWDAATGFYLNGAPVRQRGFSHHNSFAGVGVAMPQRLDLFRVQVARTLGANIWRMSHNPYRKGLYDLLDTLGVMVWNEARDFGSEYTFQMFDMAKRDRNHPSIVINSLCNEIECLGPPEAGAAAVAAAKAADPSRPTTANSNAQDGLFAVIDVQGLSHRSVAQFAAQHAQHPSQPLVSSECCSCTSQRLPRLPVADDCIAHENAPLTVPYVSGSLGVWTLMDYGGEPPGPWPYVSSSFGQLDLAGMPKPHAYWYTSNWREGVAVGDPSRVPLPPAPVARVTSLLDQLHYSPAGAGSQRLVTVAGLTSAATAELLADGVRVGAPQPANGSSVAWTFNVTVPAGAPNCSWPEKLDGVQCRGLVFDKKAASRAECAAAGCAAGAAAWQWDATAGCWTGTPNELPCPAPHAPGSAWVGGGRALPPLVTVRNATLVGRDAAGAVVATHTVLAPSLTGAGAPTALALVVDVPSPATGTGRALLLDGADAALVRVVTVDAVGVLVSGFPVNVTFAVAAGPGRVAGVGSGDPAAHEQPNGATVATFGGLARAVVQVALDCVSAHRELVLAVDADAGGRTAVLPPGTPCPSADIVLTASAPGLAGASVRIAVSGDAAADAPLAAAAAALGDGAVAYLEAFVG